MNSYLHPEMAPAEIFQNSFKNAKKISRRAKTSLVTQVSKIKLAKPQITEIINESPYAQIQTITKNRSLSSIKLKQPTKNQTNYLNTSHSNALLTKNKPNASINSFNHSENSSQLKNKLLLNGPYFSSSRPTAKLIEDKLTESLKKIKEKSMPIAKFDAFRLAFSEIIEKEDNFGGLLKRIKDAYEEKIKIGMIDNSRELVDKLKEEINAMKEKNAKNKEDKKYMIKKIEKLAKENAELSRSLDDRESRYVDLQDKLMKLSKIDMEDMPKDDNSWKYLVSENQHLIKVCEEMRKDIKHLSRKEKKLVKLIVALKNRGYPVEDVYQEDVHREKKKKILACDESVVDDSENEDLVSGRPKEVAKPAIIPSLNLEEIEVSPESSVSSYSSESEDV